MFPQVSAKFYCADSQPTKYFRWIQSDFSMQINTVCLLWLQLISFTLGEHAILPILKALFEIHLSFYSVDFALACEPDMVSNLQVLCAEHKLHSDWLKLSGWLAAPNPWYRNQSLHTLSDWHTLGDRHLWTLHAETITYTPRVIGTSEPSIMRPELYTLDDWQTLGGWHLWTIYKETKADTPWVISTSEPSTIKPKLIHPG